MGTFLAVVGALAAIATYALYKIKGKVGSSAGSTSTSGSAPSGTISKFALSKPTLPPKLVSDNPSYDGGPPELEIPGPTAWADPLAAIGLGGDRVPPPPPSAPIKGTTPEIEEKIFEMAKAIAHAEGFGIAGTLPTRAHNPGDLKLGDLGLGTISGKTIFATADEGWERLKAQIRVMFLGRSQYYTPDDTFEQIAYTWTGGDNWQPWLNTVTQDLGVSRSATLRGYLTGGFVSR